MSAPVARHHAAPPSADPIVFVGAAISRQLAEPAVLAPTHPGPNRHATICHQLFDAILGLIPRIRSDERALYFDAAETWALQADAADADRALAADWRAELGQRLAELIVSLDTSDPDATLADAIRLHARELVWRLERAGQQRLPLDDAPMPCAEDLYP